MLYDKLASTPKVEKVNIEIKDFSKGIDITQDENLTSFNSAIKCFNVKVKDGALKHSYGFKTFATPISNTDSEHEVLPGRFNDNTACAKSLYLFKKFSTADNKRIDKIMFWTDTNIVNYFSILTQYPYYIDLQTLSFSTKPFMLNFKKNNKDYIFFSDGITYPKSWEGEVEPCVHQNCPKIIYACQHKDKMFAVIAGEQDFIRYSNRIDLTSWNKDSLSSGEGDIILSAELGRINKLISFNGYLYAIRDYGITRITTYENRSDFILKDMFVSGNKIYANTCLVCGDELVMLTKEGLISFDGMSTKKINIKFENLFNKNNDSAMAAFHHGKYFLSCRINFDDNKQVGCESENGFINNALICLDLSNFSTEIIRGVDIIDLISCQVDCLDKLIVCFNGSHASTIGELTEDGDVFGSQLEKYWLSPLSDLGYSNKKKIVKNISLLSKSDCIVKIFTDKETKTLKVKGSISSQKLKVNISGTMVGFEISSINNNLNISNLKIELDLLNKEF